MRGMRVSVQGREDEAAVLTGLTTGRCDRFGQLRPFLAQFTGKRVYMR